MRRARAAKADAAIEAAAAARASQARSDAKIDESFFAQIAAEDATGIVEGQQTEFVQVGDGGGRGSVGEPPAAVAAAAASAAYPRQHSAAASGQLGFCPGRTVLRQPSRSLKMTSKSLKEATSTFRKAMYARSFSWWR